jgi:hypothetical protein
MLIYETFLQLTFDYIVSLDCKTCRFVFGYKLKYECGLCFMGKIKCYWISLYELIKYIINDTWKSKFEKYIFDFVMWVF